MKIKFTFDLEAPIKSTEDARKMSAFLVTCLRPFNVVYGNFQVALSFDPPLESGPESTSEQSKT